MSYLMESKGEAQRLLIKGDEPTTRHQLLLTGLKPGMRAVDAGGGAGFVSRIMADIVTASGEVLLVDQSDERLQVAREYTAPFTHVSFVQGPLEQIPLPADSVDYVFCRFVFEYLQNPEAVFAELVRIVRPGGKIVVGDLDYNVMTHYPLPDGIEAQLHEALGQLARKKLFDPFAGRKLYHYFYQSNCQHIQVHFLPHHLFYGEVAEKDLFNFDMKVKQIEQLSKAGVLKLSFDVTQFAKEVRAFFRSPSRFSYTPLILVEGIKAG
ncbi:MAG: class I SAM-dependent methyltransferase [Myxococcota bacterium]